MRWLRLTYALVAIVGDNTSTARWKQQYYCIGILHDYLVGGRPAPLKNMKVSWDDYSQYMEK